MKKIKLRCGNYTLIDDEDVQKMKKYTGWRTHCAPKDKRPYVYGNLHKNGKSKHIKLHRIIMNAQPGELIDHIDHNRLNNQKANLRIVTPQQNNMNRRNLPKSSSKYKGVSKHTLVNKWRARIMINKKEIHLGHYDVEKDAARAYDKKAKELFKEYAVFNFPNELDN